MPASRRARTILRPGPAQGGNTAIEAAFLFPILVLLLIGLVDVGFAVRSKMVLDGAARAGAQVALADPDDLAAIEQAVMDAAKAEGAGFGSGEAELETEVVKFCECPSGEPIDCNDSCDDGEVRHYVTVRVDGPHYTLFEYPVIGSPLSLRGRAVFRVQ